MVIPLTMEEYFDNEVCMNCHHVVDFPIQFELSNHTLLELCESCSFGLYQCIMCRGIVTHLQNTIYPEMVYTGPENTLNDVFIFCGECMAAMNVLPGEEEEPEYDTETEQEFDDDFCQVETATQILC